VSARRLLLSVGPVLLSVALAGALWLYAQRGIPFALRSGDAYEYGEMARRLATAAPGAADSDGLGKLVEVLHVQPHYLADPQAAARAIQQEIASALAAR